jgi:hypothetical protein
MHLLIKGGLRGDVSELARHLAVGVDRSLQRLGDKPLVDGLIQIHKHLLLPCQLVRGQGAGFNS